MCAYEREREILSALRSHFIWKMGAVQILFNIINVIMVKTVAHTMFYLNIG